MTKHVWNLVNNKDSIWVKWINVIKLKDRSFWDYKSPDDSCWSWRCIMECRNSMKDFVVYRLGDGTRTSAWYDNWHPKGPLGKCIERRDIYESELNLKAKVSDLVVNGEWNIPVEWKDKFKEFFDFPPPVLINGRNDRVLWRSRKGKIMQFSVGNVWADLIPINEDVKWAKLIWYSQSIPRHSFITWVAIQNKLRTHDKYMAGEVQENLRCPFCQQVKDSHKHLFFECDWPHSIWDELKQMSRLEYAPNSWDDIVAYLMNRPINKSIWSIIQRLVVGASVYFIWQERNLRLFQGKTRSIDKLLEQIKSIIRMRLLGLKIRKSKQTIDASEIWGLSLHYGVERNGADQLKELFD